jgi:hypothetical protein
VQDAIAHRKLKRAAVGTATTICRHSKIATSSDGGGSTMVLTLSVTSCIEDDTSSEMPSADRNECFW